jgi:predicted HTH domain antitoxin
VVKLFKFRAGIIMSKQVVLEFSAELPDESLQDPDVLNKGKTAIVLEMLKKGNISQGRATELLDMNRHQLFDLMSENQIPVLNLTVDELDKELSQPLNQPGTD